MTKRDKTQKWEDKLSWIDKGNYTYPVKKGAISTSFCEKTDPVIIRREFIKQERYKISRLTRNEYIKHSKNIKNFGFDSQKIKFLDKIHSIFKKKYPTIQDLKFIVSAKKILIDSLSRDQASLQFDQDAK